MSYKWTGTFVPLANCRRRRRGNARVAMLNRDLKLFRGVQEVLITWLKSVQIRAFNERGGGRMLLWLKRRLSIQRALTHVDGLNAANSLAPTCTRERWPKITWTLLKYFFNFLRETPLAHSLAEEIVSFRLNNFRSCPPLEFFSAGSVSNQQIRHTKEPMKSTTIFHE